MNICFIIFIPAAALTPNQDTSNYVEDAIEEGVVVVGGRHGLLQLLGSGGRGGDYLE